MENEVRSEINFGANAFARKSRGHDPRKNRGPLSVRQLCSFLRSYFDISQSPVSVIVLFICSRSLRVPRENANLIATCIFAVSLLLNSFFVE